MHCTIPCLLTIALLGCVLPAAAAGPRPGSAAMDRTAIQQELEDVAARVIEAVRLGDRQAMDSLLTQDMVLVNRDGKLYSRQEFLDDLPPPREGYDLGFRILESHAIPRGDAVLLSFLLDEHLVIFGQDVSTVYRNHFLFHREDGAWKLAFYAYHEQPAKPPVARLSAAEMDAVTGTYEIAPGKWVTRITRDGDRLLYSRNGAAPREFIPAAGGRFVLDGVEAEYYMERDPGGRVTALLFRRNWKDLRLVRVPPK